MELDLILALLPEKWVPILITAGVVIPTANAIIHRKVWDTLTNWTPWAWDDWVLPIVRRVLAFLALRWPTALGDGK